MKFGTLFSGIGAPEVAWTKLGWKPQFCSEIEDFPSEVLRVRHPSIPNLGDVSQVDWSDYKGSADVLCGGTPCQPFSNAGLRRGLDDPRGHLTLEFLQAVDRVRPTWVVFENVPGVLSNNGGRAFGSFVGALGELGYGWAYRILDAQYFGIPQRRRRVFLVGCVRGTNPAAAVLFDWRSLCGDSPPSRTEREEATHPIAPSVGASGRGFGRSGESRGQDPVVAIPFDTTQITSAMNRSQPTTGGPCHPIASQAHPPAIAGTVSKKWSKNTSGPSGDEVRNLVTSGLAVRRLTPREVERLQGFPDDYTQVPWKGRKAENCPDTPRYEALGNSMAVPVVEWLGERLMKVDQILLKEGITADEPV